MMTAKHAPIASRVTACR